MYTVNIFLVYKFYHTHCCVLNDVFNEKVTKSVEFKLRRCHISKIRDQKLVLREHKILGIQLK